MRQINLGWWCDFGAVLGQLGQIQENEPFEMTRSVFQYAADKIASHHSEASLVQLTISSSPANALVARMHEIIKDSNRAAPLASDERVGIRVLAQQYWTVAAEEMKNVDVFSVTRKGIYQTRLLVDHADEVLGKEFAAALSNEARDDLRSAGRALAFALPTACGFHVARATESVMLQYMKAMGCPIPTGSERSWGTYIRMLAEKGAKTEIVTHLRQIKDLYRNPLLHPEQTLTEHEALRLWSICTGLIDSMLTAAASLQSNHSDESTTKS